MCGSQSHFLLMMTVYQSLRSRIQKVKYSKLYFFICTINRRISSTDTSGASQLYCFFTYSKITISTFSCVKYLCLRINKKLALTHTKELQKGWGSTNLTSYDCYISLTSIPKQILGGQKLFSVFGRWVYLSGKTRVEQCAITCNCCCSAGRLIRWEMPGRIIYARLL